MPAPGKHPPRRRALVVDEDDLLRSLLEPLLDAEELEVETAASAELALAILDAGGVTESRAWALVVLEAPRDLQQGLALVGEIRLRCGSPAPSVVVLAASGSTAQALAYLGAGADEYVLRGVDDFAQLQARVRAAAAASASSAALLELDPSLLPEAPLAALAAIRAARARATPES